MCMCVCAYDFYAAISLLLLHKYANTCRLQSTQYLQPTILRCEYQQICINIHNHYCSSSSTIHAYHAFIYIILFLFYIIPFTKWQRHKI
jgi:hypothetical protein